MNAMDEITYWIYTKRAPCLMSYDGLSKQANPTCISNLHSTHTISDETKTPPPKKKKISLLDEDSVSEKEHGNVYFDTSQQPQNQQPVLSSCKSSDIDFNIKKSSVEEKRKRKSLQKNSRTVIHKKNIIVASTPKANVNLRRSLRNSRKSLNDPLNSSFEIFNTSAMNGISNGIALSPVKRDYLLSKERSKKGLNGLQAAGNSVQQVTKSTQEPRTLKKIESGNNAQFEEISDVSGFTASYIRSTKIHSSRKSKQFVNKGKKMFPNPTGQSTPKQHNKMLVSVNKSMNTGLPNNTTINVSTGSSQNCLNLVTMRSNDLSNKVSRSTSLLKFMNSKGTNNDTNNSNKVCLEESSELDNTVSACQSQSNYASRYPKRRKNNSSEMLIYRNGLLSPHKPLNKKPKVTKRSSSQKPQGFTTKKCNAQGLKQSGNSVLVFNNSTEVASSAVTMNVASPRSSKSIPKNQLLNGSGKKLLLKKSIGRKKIIKRGGRSVERQDSLKECGFTACFSDSDDDKPLKSQKFFC